jgi:hypothetical protein
MRYADYCVIELPWKTHRQSSLDRWDTHLRESRGMGRTGYTGGFNHSQTVLCRLQCQSTTLPREPHTRDCSACMAMSVNHGGVSLWLWCVQRGSQWDSGASRVYPQIRVILYSYTVEWYCLAILNGYTDELHHHLQCVVLHSQIQTLRCVSILTVIYILYKWTWDREGRVPRRN